MNELDIISVETKDSKIIIKIKSFTDNTEKIIKDIIKHIKEIPKKEELKYIKISMKNEFFKTETPSFFKYVRDISKRFMNKGININKTFNNNFFNNLKFERLERFHKNFLDNYIKSISFIIAGNINKTLVESIHNYIKENIKITPGNSTTLNIRNLDANLPFVINYYQKSDMMTEVDNGILVLYKFEAKYEDYMKVFSSCLSSISMPTLRFNYSNAYTPTIYIEKYYLGIFEQGKYKDVTQMEDDINEVLLGILNNEIKCENYNDIIQSFKLNIKSKQEKTTYNLFNKFINKNIENKTDSNESKEINITKNSFEDLVKEISPIFKEPQRYTFLIVRKDVSDEDFEKLFEKRKNSTYIINKEINITHTKNIYYLNTTKNN